MNRDTVIHQLIAVEAQLRRLRRLAESIHDPLELQARLPGLIVETHRSVQSLVSRINEREGG